MQQKSTMRRHKAGATPLKLDVRLAMGVSTSLEETTIVAMKEDHLQREAKNRARVRTARARRIGPTNNIR